MSQSNKQYEEDYSKHVMDLSEIRASILSLLTGFTFTAIVLFPDQITDPFSLMSQITLLFLTVLFDLFLFLLAWTYVIVIGTIPTSITYPMSKRGQLELVNFHWILFLGFCLWGYATVLMFILWNLSSLATISGLIWTVNIFIVFRLIRRMQKRVFENKTGEL